MRVTPRALVGATVGALLVCATAAGAAAQEEVGGDEVYVQQVTPNDEPEGLAPPEEGEPYGLKHLLACADGRLVAFDCTDLSSIVFQVEGSHSRNVASISQRGTANFARVVQRGAGNRTHTEQRGHANRFRARQLGSDNVIEVRLAGSGNALSVDQIGARNVYTLRHRGHGLRNSVTQIGVGLRAIQLGVGGLPVHIRQRGRGMEVRVERIPMGGGIP